jgi:hypoxanthine phosphoribosyltransferase
MDKIELHHKIFVKYMDATVIQNAVDAVARQINKEYQHDIPMVIVVLDGAIIFAADLIRRLRMPLEVCSVKYTSYQGLHSTQHLTEVTGLNRDISGRRIILVEDIVDSGLTIAALRKNLEAKQPIDIRVATLTFKREAYQEEHLIDYIGMEIENRFIVGYGMDYNQLGRNLPHIYQLETDA